MLFKMISVLPSIYLCERRDESWFLDLDLLQHVLHDLADLPDGLGNGELAVVDAVAVKLVNLELFHSIAFSFFGR